MPDNKDTSLLIEFINPFIDAISLLNTHEKNLQNQVLCLLMTCIDQLGWVCSPTEFSDQRDFKDWLNKYMDFDNLNCSADDLWVARCGLLHMGLPYNKNFNHNRDFQIAWYSNLSFTTDEIRSEENRYTKPTKLVDFNDLLSRFNQALEHFLDEYAKDGILRSAVISKLEKRPILFRI